MEVRKFLLSGSLPCLLLVYVMFCTSNNVFPQAKIDSYDADWQKVEVFKTKSLPSSALEVVERIYSRAKKDKNQPEQLKAILFKINLQEEILEESEEMAIKLVNDEVKTADFPASAIYHSVLAEMYWNYYASHRYLWLKRSITQHT